MKVQEVNAVKQVLYESTTPANRISDVAELQYRTERAAHWDRVARWMDTKSGLGGAYQRRLGEIYRFFVPPEARVLEIGCGQGDLLAMLRTKRGVGIDFSGEMIERARKRHPELHFVNADAHDFELHESFDFIILSDLVNDLWDAQRVFARLARLVTPETRLILNFYNRLWELPLSLARRLDFARPNLAQNWFTVEDTTGLLSLADFEVIGHRAEILLPLALPPLSTFANRFLAKLWPLRLAALTHFLVARPALPMPQRKPNVSVVIPARNEAGNIPHISARAGIGPIYRISFRRRRISRQHI